jgi:hypothetical protein
MNRDFFKDWVLYSGKGSIVEWRRFCEQTFHRKLALQSLRGEKKAPLTLFSFNLVLIFSGFWLDEGTNDGREIKVSFKLHEFIKNCQTFVNLHSGLKADTTQLANVGGPYCIQPVRPVVHFLPTLHHQHWVLCRPNENERLIEQLWKILKSKFIQICFLIWCLLPPLSHSSDSDISAIFDVVMSLCEARNRTTSRFSFLIGTMSSRHQKGVPENEWTDKNYSSSFSQHLSISLAINSVTFADIYSKFVSTLTRSKPSQAKFSIKVELLWEKLKKEKAFCRDTEYSIDFVSFLTLFIFSFN